MLRSALTLTIGNVKPGADHSSGTTETADLS
jgi:hypothetical protein